MGNARNEKNRVALTSVIAAIFLTSFKLVVGIITGSLGIISEALHSGLDLVAAAITWIAVRISDKPADIDHHYGHGKIENLSALIETLLLVITCAWIIYEAIKRLLSGESHIEVTIWSYVVVITSIIIDISRSRALMRVAKKHNSQALRADALHFSTDIWSSTVVLLGLICANFGIFIADSIAALIVAMIVIFVSFRLGKQSINVLLDKVPEETYRKIKNLLDDFKEIEYYHDLKVRAAGAEIFAELNIHVRSDMAIRQSHDIATAIERKIKSEIPRCHVHVHIEPDEAETKKTR
jgi:cation diffusion facilitator family transporter